MENIRGKRGQIYLTRETVLVIPDKTTRDVLVSISVYDIDKYE